MFRGLTILAIDDTPSIRTFLRVSLEGESVEFHSAEDATSGLNKCQEKNPDVVILDLGLPDKDGLEILPEIKKANANNKQPKVIVLTVRKDKKTINEAFKKGADSYLSKPFLVDDLIDVISNITQ